MFAFLIATLLFVTPQGRAAFKTALFVPQVLPSIPIKPQVWFTGDPAYREVYYPLSNGGQAVADLYLPPGGGRHSAVLFFQGVVPGGRFDPRVVALAEGLARSGMVVMMPWLKTQEENYIVVEDIDNLVLGFQYLRSLDEVDPDRVGMGGICVGASMTMVAAEDDRIRHHVKFVNLFAGYYDMYDLARAIACRCRFDGNEVTPWETDKLTFGVFRHHVIEGVPDEGDRELLTRIFKDNDDAADLGGNGMATEQGRAAYLLLEGVPFEDTERLMATLGPQIGEFMRAVSPSTNIDKISARVLIMHDRGDKLVPPEESRRMAAALSKDDRTYHTEFSFFQKQVQLHVDKTKSVGPLGFIREAAKLFMHMYNVIREI
ncbi:MAG: hypothetical protein FJ319_02980 [SAR202 cluster bacterium]|nr:hypothetical protein [SAR202 cluster bacterium]